MILKNLGNSNIMANSLSLEEVVMADTVESIGTKCFYQCSAS